MEKEIHPFEPYIPTGIKHLIIGSFPGKEQTQPIRKSKDGWYYGSPRNQFWSIIEHVYNIQLTNRKEKQDLFKKLSIGIIDIILSCRRKNDSNADNNLYDIDHNYEAILKIITNNKIENIFCTSKYVENEFLTLFPDYNIVRLPSPSPKTLRVPKETKIKFYKQLLPKIK